MNWTRISSAIVLATCVVSLTAAADPPGGQPKMLPQMAMVKLTAKSPSLTPYANQISVVIRKSWYARLLADAKAGAFSAEITPKEVSLEGTSGLEFDVASDGTVSKVSLVTGSGLKTLDAAAVESLKGLGLPALPAGTSGPQTIEAHFKMTKTSENGLADYLEMLKKKNFF